VAFPQTISAATKYYSLQSKTYTLSAKFSGNENANGVGLTLAVFIGDNSGQYIQVGPLADQAPDSATFSPPLLTTLIPVGDSTIKIDSDGSGNGAGGAATAASQAAYLNGTGSGAFIGYANAATGRPFLVPYNGGVSGERTDQFLIRLPAILAMNPGVLLIGGCANDLLQNVALATIQANYTALWDLAKAAGVPVIQQTPLPNSNITSAMKTARRTLIQWMKLQQRTRRGLYVWDPNRYVEDPMTGLYATAPVAYSADGTHPNYAGAMALGESLATFLSKTPFFVQQSGIYTHTGDDSNLLTNGVPTGTTGAKDASVTGTVPTSWAIYRASGAGTAVASMVTRTDGPLGSKSRLVIGSGSGTSQFYFQQQIGMPAAGTFIYGEAEVNIPGDWVSPYRLYMALAFAGGTGGYAVYDLHLTGADVALTTSPNRTFKFRTPAVIVPTGPTAVQLQVYVSADSGTVELLGGAVRYASAAGPV
jgi:lysophospholipase L1-like esterase